MTVEEIKAITPEADVYCLDNQSNYLIVLNKHLIGGLLSKSLGDAVKAATGKYPIILMTSDPEHTIRILKVSE